MNLGILLSLLLLLTHSQDHSIAWVTSDALQKPDAECLVYYGLKKIFIHDNFGQIAQSLLFLKNNFPVIPDAHIYIRLG